MNVIKELQKDAESNNNQKSSFNNYSNFGRGLHNHASLSMNEIPLEENEEQYSDFLKKLQYSWEKKLRDKCAEAARKSSEIDQHKKNEISKMYGESSYSRPPPQSAPTKPPAGFPGAPPPMGRVPG